MLDVDFFLLRIWNVFVLRERFTKTPEHLRGDDPDQDPDPGLPHFGL